MMRNRRIGIWRITIGVLALFVLAEDAFAQSAGLSVVGTSTVDHAAIADTGADDSFGLHTAIGDFNGDGIDDLAIGDPHDDTVESNQGAVHIIYGASLGPDPLDTQSLRQNAGGVSGNDEPDDQFGGSLAVGNFNGDAYDDLAVGSPFEDIGAINGAGAIHVFFGSASGLRTDNEQSFNQDSPGILGVAETADQFGAALAAGDFNGDSFDDLAIGVPGQDLSGQINAGMVNVLPGSASGLTDVGDLAIGQDLGTILDTAEFNDQFGSSLAAGDFNGDGRDDLAIGIPNETVNAISGAGAVAAIYGHASLLLDFGTNQFWHQDVSGVLGVPGVNYGWGWALAACDFNNDGRDDLVVSSPGATEAGSAEAGIVQVLPGLEAAGNTLWAQGFNLPGTAGVNDRFGESLACGDFNGDGRDDLAIAAHLDDDAEGGAVTDAGVVSIVYGTASGLQSAGAQSFDRGNVAIGSAAGANDQWASALAAGDLDGNGYADLAVGMVPVVNDGEIDVLLGGTDIDTDGDGLTDWEEERIYFSNPALTDSDGDGLSDGDEVFSGTDPLDPDTDGDLVCDGGALVPPCTVIGPDNCPFIANFNQDNSDPFAAGDGCQCGDVDGDNAVTAVDLVIARENLVGATPSGSFDANHCDYGGDPGCGVDDTFILDRILNGKAIPFIDACPAYGRP